MTAQPLNYCRSMVKQFTTTMKIPSFPLENKRMLSHAIDLAASSKKFIMPSGGRLFDDKEYKALDENEVLRLPYPMIAMEYEQTIENDYDETMGRVAKSSKRIVFARERDGHIYIFVCCWVDSQGMWAPLPSEVALPVTGYLDRSNKSQDGRVLIRAQLQHQIMPLEDFSDEIGSLLCLLNSLQCSNVKIEHHAPRVTRKKIKTAHAFDSYHFLMIDAPKQSSGSGHAGGHRSPREHLRRGHIRRLEDRKIWVNASVVGAGAAGRVSKDYIVRQPASPAQCTATPPPIE